MPNGYGNDLRAATGSGTERPTAQGGHRVGTTIEWYDFFLYGTAAGLVFGKLFFPNQEPLAATLAAFGTYFIGFAARPIGAAIFGHYGDRIGRKATLIATLLLMGVATFLIAFVPTDAPEKEAAHRYRLAQATKILRLHGASAQQQTAGRHHYGEEPA